MFNWEEGPEDNYDDAAVEESYSEWLDETCSCDIENEGCNCMSFEEWGEERLSQWDCCEEDYEEECG